MKARTIITAAISAVLVLGIGFFAGRRTCRPQQLEILRRDTVTVTDTIVREIPVPRTVTVVRIDTCYLSSPTDTIRIPVAVPIERKTYTTPDYRAVVEGYRPSLVEMQVYQKQQTITQTIPISNKSKRWGIGIQAGYGYIPIVNKTALYIGVGVQYDLLSF
jgi:hypothetical protein